MSTPRLRILLAKPGLDGHDQGAKIVVRGLIEAGFEVLYTGLRKTPEEIVRAAVDEDVDVIGLSILSGSHLSICRKLRRLMDENGLADRLWVVGGNIPAADRQALKELGVAEVFPTGSRLEAIVDFLRARAPERVG
ncbi:cobalamin B12-binding domain-containing protein [bacterium CPR1]|nr:cobalamin B12-binding domain-containing protein [bacterium CPR1]